VNPMGRPPARRARSLGAVALALATGPVVPAPVLAAAPQSSAAGMTVAKLVWGDRPVERAEEGGESWQRLREGDPLRTGDRLRTTARGVARLDFPWMAVTLGPSSTLSVPASAVLSTVLEKGRAEFSGEGRDIVKIHVGEGEIRGGGRLVLWHEGERTAAAALEGAFRVSGGGATVEIKAGQGTSMIGGQAPAAASPLPDPPGGLVPGGDPAYVPSGKTAELHWTPAGSAHHVEVLALQSDDVLLARNVGEPPLRIEIPWLGTYRWRVSARDARGLEGPPSTEGYVCVVEK
jgi:hypothetical protein